MKSRHSLRWAIAVALLSMLAACGGSSEGSDSGLKTVNFGGQGVTADAGLYVADAMGYFEDEGLELKYNRLTDASAITNSLATGHLDVAGATITPGTFEAAKQDLGIKIVGDKNFMKPPSGDLPAMSGTRLAVLPQYDKGDLGATFEALKGKKLAIHSNLSIQIVYLGMLLEKYGFSLDDFEITPVLSPDQTAALKGGSIDAAVMQEPYFSAAVADGTVKPVSDMTEELPEDGASTTALLYGRDFMEDKETAEKFMVAYMKGVRTYNDAMFYGKDKDKVVDIIAEATDVPSEQIASTFPPGLDPDQNISLDWLAVCEEFYQENGMFDGDVDPADMVDTSFRDHAIDELGEYEPPA